MALKLGELVAILGVDDKKLRDGLDRSKSRMEQFGSGAGKVAGQIAKAFGPALLPVLAASAAGVAGLGAALAGAGAAGVVFGAVFKSNFGEIKEASDKTADLRDKIALLNEQIKVAKSMGNNELAGNLEKSRTRATNELLARYKQLPPAQRAVVQSYDQMKMSWQSFVDANKPQTYAIMTTGFNTIRTMIPKLQPLFDVASAAVSRFAGWLAHATATGGVDRFVAFLTAQAGPAIDHIAAIGRNLGITLGALFKNTAPSGQGMLGAIELLTEKLANWSAGGGFERFMQYVSANGPSISATMGNLATAAGQIYAILSPLAPVTRAIATAMTQLIAAVPPEVITTLVTAWLAYNVVLKAHDAILLLLKGKTLAVAAASKLAAAGQAIWNAAVVAGNFVAASAQIAGYLIKVAAVRLAALGAAAAQAIWNAALVVGNFAAATAQIAGYLIKVAAVRVATLATAAAQAIWNAALVAGNFAAATAQLAGFLIKQGAIAIATKAWTAAQWLLNLAMTANPIGLVIAAVVALIAIFAVLWIKSEGFRTFWINLWETIKNAASAAWSWITTKTSQFWSWISAVPGRIGSAFSNGWSTVKTKAGQAFDWVKNKALTWYNWVTGLPSKISSKMSGAFTGLWTGFKAAANKLIGGWNRLSFGIPGFSFAGMSVPGLTINTPDIPYLAQGGIVPATPGGRLAVIGEGGQDEAVIPLDRLKQLLGSMRSVLELRSSGSALDDLLVEILRGAIKWRGGDVQVVLGQGSGG
ncbi:hypothetical protein AB0M02_00455 [Actinoplanes sp. NPDC051861]|uniref:hypothetical protein n=1 Tax=Actinoplanes sp. NPDC051861 TaxID=3155170 RepID=UPI003432F3AC